MKFFIALDEFTFTAARPRLAIILVFVLCFFCPSASEGQINRDLKMVWGLNNTKYYVEEKTRVKGVLHRSIHENKEYFDEIFPLMRRFNRSIKFYPKINQHPIKDHKQELMNFLKESDPYLVASIRKMAPTIYFDFMGSKSKEYVLQCIKIQTLDYSVVKGGGFSDNEDLWDIELSHKKGTKLYKRGKKLRFSGSGRCVLRFWSDYFNEVLARPTVGIYTINITFSFLVDGKIIEVSTGPFGISV